MNAKSAAHGIHEGEPRWEAAARFGGHNCNDEHPRRSTKPPSPASESSTGAADGGWTSSLVRKRRTKVLREVGFKLKEMKEDDRVQWWRRFGWRKKSCVVEEGKMKFDVGEEKRRRPWRRRRNVKKKKASMFGVCVFRRLCI